MKLMYWNTAPNYSNYRWSELYTGI